ncbi:thioredoxin family protein [Flavobacterium sp. LS1R49]|uniref:Thioredoxin family protein n=1 Tax=Flavobacterium shii TaxID=2987687 RepID=A0A9X2ZGI8_9FLAO|nr:thioredoxin family protein [Flavobacterium shii]MCV9929377.1 thioredoxin family protein [Flavobacterium shii]
MMKKLLVSLFFLGFISTQAQNLIWKTNINDAIEISNQSKKPMLIMFTANNLADNLQNEIMKTLDFALWSRDNVILVKLDLSDSQASDSDKEQNLKLKNAFGVQDLPEICFANAVIRKNKTTFQALGKMAYKSGGVKAWITESNAILHPSDF